MNSRKPGTLYIVATPIGNLNDMVPRAVQTLQQVDLIACEDTRHSRKLLDHFSIDRPLRSYHEHSDRDSSDKLLARLDEGESIALISDAGTPLISDPGYRLVRQARSRGIDVVPVPGACAAIAALSASGIATDGFRFCGFLPAKSGNRGRALTALAEEAMTLVFYEAPHRIVDTLQDISEIFGPGRYLVMAREVTKAYETFLSGSVDQVLELVQGDSNQQRGEIVLIVEGCSVQTAPDDKEQERVLLLLLDQLPPKRAAALTAEIVGGDKKQLYKLGLSLKDR